MIVIVFPEQMGKLATMARYNITQTLSELKLKLLVHSGGEINVIMLRPMTAVIAIV